MWNKEKIEKKIQWLVGNTYSVLLKEAFVQLAPIMITVGIGLFVYSLGLRWFPDQMNEWTQFSVWVYGLLCLGLSSLIIIKITGTMQKTEKASKEAGALSAMYFFLFVGRWALDHPEKTFIDLTSASIVPAMIFGFLFGCCYRLLLRFRMSNPFPQTIPQAVMNVWNDTWQHAIMLMISIVFAWFTPIYTWMMVGVEGILSVLNTPSALIVIVLLICTFWLKGIHGVAVIGLFLRPFWFQMLIMNGADYLTGQPLAYIFHESFLQWIVWIGGSGATLGLAICLKLFSKSQRLKSLAESGTTSTWFNINETVMYGIPVANNNSMVIPFILSPLMNGIIGYFLISNGFLGNLFLTVPWVFPAPIGLFLATGGDLRAILVSFLLIGLSAAIYYPFFNKIDRIEQEEQAKQL